MLIPLIFGLLSILTMVTTLGQRPIKFIHISKTAGTSIEDWGKQHDYSWGRFDPGMRLKLHYPFIFKDLPFKRKHDWFVIVRNPFARVVSEFYHSQNNLFAKNTSADRVINKTQAEMNEWIQRKLETRLHPTIWWHWTDQYLYVSNNNQCKCNITIIYYENLIQEFRKLMNNPKITLPKSNTHTAKQLSTRNLTRDTARMIFISYYQDFKLFRYPRDVTAAHKLPRQRLTQEKVPDWGISSEKYRMGVPT